MKIRQRTMRVLAVLAVVYVLLGMQPNTRAHVQATGRALATDTITINGGGGVDSGGLDGIKMVFNIAGSSEQVSFTNREFIYADGDVGVHLNVGGTLYTTMRGSSASGDLSNSAKFDNLVISGLTGTASNAGGSTPGDGSVVFTYQKTIGGKLYELKRTVSYTYPNQYYTDEFDVTVPAGNAAVIKLYKGGDTSPGGGDSGRAAYFTAPVRDVQSVEATSGVVFGMKEIAQETGMSTFEGAVGRNYTDPYPEVLSGGDIGFYAQPGPSTHDVGFMVQYNIGDDPNTPTVEAAAASTYHEEQYTYLGFQRVNLEAAWASAVVSDVGRLNLTMKNAFLVTKTGLGFDFEIPSPLIIGAITNSCGGTLTVTGNTIQVTGVTMVELSNCLITVDVGRPTAGTSSFTTTSATNLVGSGINNAVGTAPVTFSQASSTFTPTPSATATPPPTFTPTPTATATTPPTATSLPTATPTPSGQTITFAAPTGITSMSEPFPAGATSSAGLAITYSGSTPAVCTVTSSGTVTVVGPGTCTIIASQIGGTIGGVVYTAAPDVTRSFAIPAGQTITFPAIRDKVYNAPDFALTASASSTLPVSYSSATPTVCLVTSSGTVHLVAKGTCSVTASQAGGMSGGLTYAAAPNVTKSFAVKGAPQAITATTSFQKYAYSGPFDLDGTTPTGLPIVYESLNPAVCSVAGKRVTVVGTGTCNIKAKQAGGLASDGIEYDAAPDVTIAINVTNATATNTPTATKTATPTPNQFALKKAAVGASFVLGLLYNNTLVTWGMNKEYQANIPPCCGAGITDVSVGTNFAVALKGGRVYGWGSNSRGQITIPVQATKDVIAISSGYAHTLAIKSNGTVVCWGNNVEKQCNMPKTLRDVTQVAGGQDYSLALKKDGTVVGWGANKSGQIKIPVGLKGVKAITAGCTHALALKKDGNVVGWGSNTYKEAKVPLNLKDVKEIGAGCNYSMAMMNDGTLFGWGRNENNQVTIPTGINNAEHIGVGYVNSIITLRNSVVLAIGASANDALVSRTPTKSATPTP
jgi:hypothetical protein